MKLNEFQKINKYITEKLQKAEEEAFDNGVDINSQKFKDLFFELKKQIITSYNIDVNEYLELENDISEGRELSESDVLYFPTLAKKSRENAAKTQAEIKKEIDKIYSEYKSELENVSTDINGFKRKTAEEILGLRGEIEKVSKEKQQVVRTLVREENNARVDELREDLLNLQSANSYIYEQMDKARKQVESLLPKNFQEQWELLTTGGLADALHTHDIRQRRGYGGVDRETVISLINQFGGSGGSPGGSTTQLQYNNAGAFGGVSGATWDGTHLFIPKIWGGSTTTSPLTFQTTTGNATTGADFIWQGGNNGATEFMRLQQQNGLLSLGTTGQSQRSSDRIYIKETATGRTAGMTMENSSGNGYAELTFVDNAANQMIIGIENQSGPGVAGEGYLGTNRNTGLNILQYGVPYIYISNNANFNYIGMGSGWGASNLPLYPVDINGTLHTSGDIVDGNVLNATALGTDGSGTIIPVLGPSSIRYKKNVKDIEFDVEKFMELRPVNFKYKNYPIKGEQVGFIAEEVEKLFPEIVRYENGRVENVDYLRLPMYLFAIVKEQQKRINLLESKI